MKAASRMAGIMGAVAVAAVAASAIAAGPAFPQDAHAHPHAWTPLAAPAGTGAHTETTALAAGIGIEKTTIAFHAPLDNALPWGFVEGRVDSHVPGHPVIIQIYAGDGSAVHFAQVDVADDGAYEYKFRVRNVESDGTATLLFTGDYTVAVYKVVYLSGHAHA